MIARALCTLVPLLALTTACDPDRLANRPDAGADTGPTADSGPTTDAGPTAECLDLCVEAEMAAFPADVCGRQCQDKSRHLRVGAEPCQDLCAQAAERRRRLVTMRCRTRCELDADGDGVPDGIDRCPDTPPDSRVTWAGCPDRDGDGVPDPNDACPDDAGTPPGHVTVAGCPVPPCEGDHCGAERPRCESEAECDRASEIRVPLEVPVELRHAYIRRLLSIRAHEVRCPDSSGPPPQPTLVRPSGAVLPILGGEVSVVRANGEIVDATSVPIDLEWSPVESDCGPVRYSVLVDYHYCHQIGNIVEPATYWNIGWCRWVPLRHETLDATSYALELPVGRLLYELREPIGHAIGWTPTDGTMTLKYRPLWFRLRVTAHDGNGATSDHGLHTDHRYIVVHQDADVAAEAIYSIPVAP